MASKKGTSKPKKIAISNGKNQQTVAKFMNVAKSAIQRGLQETKIPVFTVIAQDPQVVINYFTNRVMYADLVGVNLDLFDRVVRNAYANMVATDVKQELAADENAVYPGLWNSFNITALAIRLINVMDLERPDEEVQPGEPKVVAVMSMHPVGSDDTKWEEGTYLRFDQFNPTKLYQYMSVVRTLILQDIVKDIQETVPAINLSTSNETQQHRLGRLFCEAVQAKVVEWRNDPETVNDITIQAQAVRFIEYVQQPMVNFWSILLFDAGVGDKAIHMAVADSDAKIRYEYVTKTGKTAPCFVHRWTNMMYYLFSKNNPKLGCRLSICPKDIVDVCLAEQYDIKPDKVNEAMVRIGKGIKSFIDSMIVYIYNMYISEKMTRPMSLVKQSEMATPDEETSLTE